MEKCNRPGCLLAGSSFGDCGSIKPCPRPKEVDPDKDVVLSCQTCNKVWAVPADSIVQGRIGGKLRSCPATTCDAVVIPAQPKAPKKKAAKKLPVK